MASESGDREGSAPDGDDGVEASHEPRECMPCRGKGQVISNLGGTPSSVTCPWCGGSGVRQADVDAQARWRQEGGGQDAAQPPPEPAA